MNAKRAMRVAYISDVHAPYEDKDAWRLTMDILKDIHPDHIFFGGDIVDFYAVSSFNRDPRRVVRFQEELDCGIALMKEAQQYADSEGWFYPGNHEGRINRFKNERPELVSLSGLKLPQLLNLKDLGLKYIPYGTPFKLGDLYYLHGDEAAGGSIYPARNLYLKEMGNLIFGHYHKSQVFYNRLRNGTTYGSWANPCLCQFKQEYVKGTSQWQQGFSVISYHGSLFRVDQIVYFRHDKYLYGAWSDKLYSVKITSI